MRLDNADRLRLISVDGKILRMAVTDAAKHVIWLRSKEEALSYDLDPRPGLVVITVSVVVLKFERSLRGFSHDCLISLRLVQTAYWLSRHEELLLYSVLSPN